MAKIFELQSPYPRQNPRIVLADSLVELIIEACSNASNLNYAWKCFSGHNPLMTVIALTAEEAEAKVKKQLESIKPAKIMSELLEGDPPITDLLRDFYTFAQIALALLSELEEKEGKINNG